jgi:hypothetical protein
MYNHLYRSFSPSNYWNTVRSQHKSVRLLQPSYKNKGQVSKILKLLKPVNYYIVYIDGSHRAIDVAADASLSWPLLKTGGMIIFDDYLWELERPIQDRPQMAIDHFLTAFRSELAVLHKGYQVIARKLADRRWCQMCAPPWGWLSCASK